MQLAKAHIFSFLGTIMKKTIGETAFKAAKDTTNYKAKEVGHALVEDNSVADGLRASIELHKHLTSEKEFCVGYVIASDPLIKGVMRRKFFCWLYLPMPRPEQAIFLYNKELDEITKRLWVLPAAYSSNPDAWTMEKLYQAPVVPKGYETMKEWSEAFYDGHFYEFIRKQHNIDMLSESEYLNANREKLIKAGCKEIKSGLSESFDFSKITINKIVDTKNALVS